MIPPNEETPKPDTNDPGYYALGRRISDNVYYKRIFRLFRYPQLPGPDYIRLLHLHPTTGSSQSRLEGCLRVHKLDAQCDYEAISYSWGDHANFDQGIILNGQVLKMTRNLYAALKAYRYYDRPRALWADAVCIDQSDAAEKSRQVAIMADIYSKARAVQVWLGPGSPYTTEAMKFMESLSLRSKSFGIHREDNNPELYATIPFLDISDDEAENLVDDALKSHVESVLFRSWFNRVWVVQEATLATELVVSLGDATLSWADFARAVEILRGARRKLTEGEKRSRLDSTRQAWELVRHRNNFRLLDEFSNRDHHWMTTMAIYMMRRRDCKDDRDRVYAILSMTKSPYNMVPDYDRTVEDVYAEFAQRYSPNTQLYWAGLCRRKRPSESENGIAATGPGEQITIDVNDRDFLPSWAPELRPSLTQAWNSPFDGEYSTAHGAPIYFSTSPGGPKVMLARGTLFDVVYTATWEYYNNTTGRLLLDPGFFFPVISQLRSIFDGIPLHDSVSEFKPSSEPVWLTLAKVLTMGVGECEGAEIFLSQFPHFKSLEHLQSGSLPWLTAIWNRFEKHCFSPTGEAFQNVLLRILSGEPRPLSPDGLVAFGFLNHLATTLDVNRLFVTMGGYLGIAPRDIRPGDFIAVMNGCEMPYVVRAAGKKYKIAGGMEGNPWLEVVGPCYLEGIMKGEIYKNRDAPEFSHLEWTRYDGDEVDSLAGALVLV
ncbi:hypothetical protein NUW58_g6075 [Xylaria curta]|uniref:Uncharacterized protein n=1 Tax=Xylaria curta TaxID=42375 RepID=A0ACC1NZS8_9PEZI|nr:hypothetical protein NUW58_g6075 [Xylaria curta]